MTIYNLICGNKYSNIQGDLERKGRNSTEREILSRVATLALAPLSVISCAADGVIGAGMGIAAIVTGGKYSLLNNKSAEHLEDFGHIASSPYLALLGAINPNAQLYNDSGSTIDHLYAKIEYKKGKLYNLGIDFNRSGNFLKRHVAARLSFALWGVAATADRVAKGVVGAIAIPLSLLTLGKFTTLNFMAEESLKMPLIIKDLFCSTLPTMNPRASSSFKAGRSPRIGLKPSVHPPHAKNDKKSDDNEGDAVFDNR